MLLDCLGFKDMYSEMVTVSVLDKFDAKMMH